MTGKTSRTGECSKSQPVVQFLRIRNLELTNDIDAGLQIASRYNMAHMALGARLLRQELIRGAVDSIQAPFPLGAVGLTTCCTADLPSSTEQ